MPQIPEWAASNALRIFKGSTFEATVKIGKQQRTNGEPLGLGAGQRAVNQLLDSGSLIINAEGKIDVPSQSQNV